MLAVAFGAWTWLRATTTWRVIDEASAERALRGRPWARPRLRYTERSDEDTNHSRQWAETGTFGNLQIGREEYRSEMTDSSGGHESVASPQGAAVRCDWWSGGAQWPFVTSHLVLRASREGRVIQFQCAIEPGRCHDADPASDDPNCATLRRVLSLSADDGARWRWAFSDGSLVRSPGPDDRAFVRRVRIAAGALVGATLIELLALVRELRRRASRPLMADPQPYRTSALLAPAPPPDRGARWHRLAAAALVALAVWLTRSGLP
ncbi:MAG: hypothetical protein JWM10_4485 [Myxococcaceae bacterium]|nr:hypothetical protein [Myxococcaceae bacterium]